MNYESVTFHSKHFVVINFTMNFNLTFISLSSWATLAASVILYVECWKIRRLNFFFFFLLGLFASGDFVLPLGYRKRENGEKGKYIDNICLLTLWNFTKNSVVTLYKSITCPVGPRWLQRTQSWNKLCFLMPRQKFRLKYGIGRHAIPSLQRVKELSMAQFNFGVFIPVCKSQVFWVESALLYPLLMFYILSFFTSNP